MSPKPHFLAVDEQTTHIALLRGKLSDAMKHPDFRRNLTVVAEPDLSEAWYFYHDGWQKFSQAGLKISPEWYIYALQTYIRMEQDALRKARRLQRVYWAAIAVCTALGGLAAAYLIISVIVH